MPFQGLIRGFAPFPRALPWASLDCAFQASSTPAIASFYARSSRDSPYLSAIRDDLPNSRISGTDFGQSNS